MQFEGTYTCHDRLLRRQGSRPVSECCLVGDADDRLPLTVSALFYTDGKRHGLVPPDREINTELASWRHWHSRWSRDCRVALGASRVGHRRVGPSRRRRSRNGLWLRESKPA
jgi:hypothetical protein